MLEQQTGSESATTGTPIGAPASGDGNFQPLVALLPSALAFAWLGSKASWFWQNNPDMQFGWIVVMLCGYLLWEAWEQKPPVRFGHAWQSTALALGAACWLFLAQVYQAAFGSSAASINVLAFGLMGIIAANLLYVFGWAGVRHFAFGCGFFWMALPWPSFLRNAVVGSLQTQVASANVELLNLIGVPAQKLGSLIQLPTCVVGVDEACSGIRSLQSTIMATLFLGALTLRTWTFRIGLFFAGMVLAILGNLIRSFYLSLTANNHGLEALKAHHDSAGWSILVFTVVGVAICSWAFGKLESRLAEQMNKTAANPVDSPKAE